MNGVFAVAALGLIACLVIFWSTRVPVNWKTARNLSAHGSSADHEQVEQAWKALVRDAVLALVSVGAAGYFLIMFSQAALADLVGPASSQTVTAIGRGVGTPGSTMEGPAQVILHLSLGIASFFILTALIYPILPGILPVRGDSRLSTIFSAAIAVSLASAGALFIAIPSQASNRLVDDWSAKLGWLLAEFISVLMGVIGVYLVWKNIWRHIKPK